MSWVRIWVHLVFSTKNRQPLLSTPEIRNKVFTHIQENAMKKKIILDSINGYTDHAHCLVGLHKDQSICDIAHLIKGESSFWINRSGLIETKFCWQDDYWAVGISENHLPAVRNYIDRQEKHHQYHSFGDELNRFLIESGWSSLEDHNDHK